MELKTKEQYFINIITISGLIIASIITYFLLDKLLKKHPVLFWVVFIGIILLLIIAIYFYNKTKSNPEKHEYDIIQHQVDEIKQHFKNFSFLTEYDELHNCRGIPKSPICVSNNDGDAIRRFFKYVKNLLTNNLNSNHKGPLQNDSFNIYFPPETSKIANDIKIILNKFLKTIDFIKRSISYKQENQNIIHILDVLTDDIRESLLNHEGILLSITDDLFPRAIQLCNEKKVFPINNLTTFLEGLIEIKIKFIKLKNSINGDITKVNGNPTPRH